MTLSRGADARRLQRALRHRAFMVDRIDGPPTAAAVQRFQVDAGPVAGGEVDPLAHRARGV